MVSAFVRYTQWFGRTDYLGCYIAGSEEKHKLLKEMEAKQIEKQRLVVNLVSLVAQATAMARSEIKRERKKEEGRKKVEIPPLKRKYRRTLRGQLKR